MPLITTNPNIDIASDQQPSIYYLDDGTAIFKVVSDPNGVIIANAGSLALRNDGTVYAKSSNNDSANWNVVGGGTPGLPLNSVQFNDGGSFGGNAGFTYDPTSNTNLNLTALIANGFSIKENGSSPPATIGGAPILLNLHTLDDITYFGLGYSSDATNYQWANWLSSDGALVFDGEDTTAIINSFSFQFTPGANQGDYYFYPEGIILASRAFNLYGGFAELSDSVFGLILTDDTPTTGTLYVPLTWTNSAVGINNTSPVAALDLLPFAQTQKDGIKVTRNYSSAIGNIFPTAIDTAITINTGAIINSVLSAFYSSCTVNDGSVNYFSGFNTYQEYYGGTVNNYISGIESYIYIENGTMPAVYGLRSRIEAYAPAAITASYNLYLDNAANNATDAWAIYSTGLLKSFIGGTVGINAINPLATFHVNASAAGNVAGLFITNAGSVDNFQISVNNGVSSAIRANSAGRMILTGGTTAFSTLTSGTNDFRFNNLAESGLPTTLTGSYSNTANDAPTFAFLRSRGAQATPNAVQNNDNLGRLDWFAQFNTSLNNVRVSASIQASASETHSNSAGGSKIQFFTITAAGTSLTEKMRLNDGGMLQIGNTATFTSGVNLFSVGNITNNSANVASIAARNTAHIALDVYNELNTTVEVQRWFQTNIGTKIASVMGNGKFETRAGQNGTNIASDFISLDGTYDVFTNDANNGTTVETDLHSKTVSGNVLATDGDILYCVSTITTANNANNKTIKAYWNGVAVLDTTAFPFINDVLTLEVWILRTGATTQKVTARLTNKDATFQLSTYNTGAATLSGSVIYKITGQSDTASNDVTAKMTVLRKGNNQ